MSYTIDDMVHMMIDIGMQMMNDHEINQLMIRLMMYNVIYLLHPHVDSILFLLILQHHYYHQVELHN
jgi:hypothetical protein